MRRQDYEPPPYLVPRAHLEFDLGLDVTTVRAELTLERNPAAGGKVPLRLDGVGFDLLDITIDGRPPDGDAIAIDASGLTILRPTERFELSVTTRLRPSSNTSLVGLYATEGQLCTHCEPQGFRRITYFPDRPDVLTRFSVRLAGDASTFPVLLANGNPAGRGDCGGGRHWALWIDPHPKACYLFALVAGRFARRSLDYRTGSGRRVVLSVYAAERDIERLGFALESLQAALAWDEHRYGRECDLDVYNLATVADHNFGAMENKGLNIYSRASIVTTEGRYTSDDDYRLIALNIAHEYFHNWTGNRVTCRDWFQLALKEGLTTYRTEQFEQERFGYTPSRIALARNLQAKLFAEESAATAHAVVPDHAAEVANLYDSTVYLKGAAIVRMLHVLVGEDGYRRACDLYFERYDGTAVTVEEFVAVCEQASGRDLTQFRRWYYQAGTPTIRVRGRHDAQSRTYRLTLTQDPLPARDGAAAGPLHIPVRVGLIGRDGQEVVAVGDGATADADDRLIELRETDQEIVFHGISEEPIPSLLRDFTAPVRLEFPYADDDLLLLARRDRDGFNRWRALQLYYTRIVLGGDAIDAAVQPLLGLLGDLLEAPSPDPAMIAEMLTVPLEKELAESAPVIDVERICGRRDALRRVLARGLKEPLFALYQSLASSEPYRFDVDAAAARRLRNVSLSCLVTTGEDQFRELAVEQAERSGNMTDEAGAAAALNQCGGEARERVFALLLERWRVEPLAIDRWFQLQGLDESPGVATRIQTLQSHPEFDLRRISRVRSLFAWFFIVNFRGLHERPGGAYDHLVRVVADVDALNDVAAAWLLRKSDLVRWRRFTSPRREQMQRALRQLLTVDGLSTGVREPAVEALAEA